MHIERLNGSQSFSLHLYIDVVYTYSMYAIETRPQILPSTLFQSRTMIQSLSSLTLLRGVELQGAVWVYYQAISSSIR